MPAAETHVTDSPLLADPAIASLPGVLDARAFTGQLAEFLPAGAAGLEVLHVQLLRHHAGKRCVLELTLRSREGPIGLIGKLYAKDRSHVYRLMEDLRRSGFGSHERFSIPQPLAYLEPLHLLLQEKVEGRPATDWFLSDDEAEGAEAARRCADWLAAFHGRALQQGPRVEADGVLALERWTMRVVGVSATLGDRASVLLERLKAAAQELPPAELCTIHGDYSHHQVILTPTRTVTIDWDRHCLADPVQDVARFSVGLQRLALRRRGSMRGLDGAVRIFLESYLASAPLGRTARLPFHRAAICLEHAKHDVHKQADGWPERTAATLEEGLRVLAEGC